MATETTKITYVEGAAASTPAAGRVVTYPKADGLMYSKDDAGVETLMSAGAGGAPSTLNYLVGTATGSLSAEIVVGTVQAHCEGRLTLTTAVPVTTADVTAATTLYFTPFRGNQISTYSGTAWSTANFTEKSITLATLTAGLPYDVFIVDSTLALELLAWTNATTRATALATQDGILCKTGALTRRYLGTICIAATGQCEDSLARRLVWNYYNRLARPMQIFDATDNWTYGTATWRAANGTTTDHRVDYVQGVSEDIVRCEVTCSQYADGSVAGAIGIGVDSTSANSALTITEIVGFGASSTRLQVRATYRGWPGVGYHTLTWLEYARAGTTTYGGDGGVADQLSGVLAEVAG